MAGDESHEWRAAPMLPGRLPLLVALAALDAAWSSLIEVEVRNGHAGGLVFLPSNIVAGLGDIVSFVFIDEAGGPVNHSIVQTSYEHPCTPLEGGFASPTGSMPNGSSYSIFVFNYTQTIWFACGHPNHCQGGDVGAINAPTTGFPTLATFRASAESIFPDNGASFAGIPPNGTGTGVLPEGVGVIGYLPPGADSRISLPLSTASFPWDAPTPGLENDPPLGTGVPLPSGQTSSTSGDGGTQGGSRLGAGPIAGIVAASVGVVALLAFVLWRTKLIDRRRKRTSVLAHKLDVALARAEARKSVTSAYELKGAEKAAV